MTIEYHLQKRGLSMWQYVTWYDNEVDCKKNFDKASVESNGYSWRMVRLEVIEESLLNGERRAEPDDEEPYVPNKNTVSIPVDDWRKLNMGVPETPSEPVQPVKSGWGVPSTDWGKNLTSEASFKAEHGLTGSVWIGNPVTKEKRRVVGFEAAKMLNEGWIKAGPRTVL